VILIDIRENLQKKPSVTSSFFNKHLETFLILMESLKRCLSPIIIHFKENLNTKY
jgi:hypothetical protein